VATDLPKQGTMKAAIQEGLMSAALRIVRDIIAIHIPALPHPPVNKGVFEAGWRTEAADDGVFIFNVAPHAPFIEFGVRGSNVRIGGAMIRALTEWVIAKGVGARISNSASPGKAKVVRATVSEATSIAWAIAKSMQKRGIFAGGLHILEKAVQQAVDSGQVAQEIERSIDKAFGNNDRGEGGAGSVSG